MNTKSPHTDQKLTKVTVVACAAFAFTTTASAQIWNGVPNFFGRAPAPQPAPYPSRGTYLQSPRQALQQIPFAPPPSNGNGQQQPPVQVPPPGRRGPRMLPYPQNIPGRAQLAEAPIPLGHVRIKDITDIEGVEKITLRGFGLVTGLKKTGGNSPITRQLLVNYLDRMGLRSDPTQRAALANDARLRTDNVSAVSVIAQVPQLLQPGQTFDVQVATLDDADSLRGGILQPTTLIGVDGHEYALASGAVSMNGFTFGGQAATVQKNHDTTARVPNGAALKTRIDWPIPRHGNTRLLLRDNDLKTTHRIAEAINRRFPGAARAVHGRVIDVFTPPQWGADITTFLMTVRDLTVKPDTPARVVINDRTGTIIAGGNVRISQVAITHANLTVVTGERPEVSQPAPFSDGQTVVVPRTDINVNEQGAPVSVLGGTTTVAELAEALNALGVTPQDLSAIFQQLKEAGALHADLEIK